jgi:hypothetical protein
METIDATEILRMRDASRGQLDREGQPIAQAFGLNPSKGYIGTTVGSPERSWAVCRARLQPSAGRLLDAAVAYKRTTKSAYGLALLQPPEPCGDRTPADAAFMARFQRAVWNGFGIAFLQETDDSSVPLWPTMEDLEPAVDGGTLDRIRDDLIQALRGDEMPEDFLHESRDAEAVVRLAMHKVLLPRGYKRSHSHFHSMWRSASTDGSWEKANDPRARIALEVKLNEDIGWPLSQPLDYLGCHDAVIQVRLVTKKLEPKLAMLPKELLEAVATAQSRLPFRAIDIFVGRRSTSAAPALDGAHVPSEG